MQTRKIDLTPKLSEKEMAKDATKEKPHIALPIAHG
jgi:hypothetical protein